MRWGKLGGDAATCSYRGCRWLSIEGHGGALGDEAGFGMVGSELCWSE